MKTKFRNWVLKVLLIFRPICPSKECNGKLKYSFHDMEYDKAVFKCDKCSIEYI